MEHEGLASELLHEVKLSARRWFLIAVAELIVIVILVLVTFIIPVEEVSVENDDGNATYIGRDLNGGLDNGEGNLQETSGSEKAAP